MEIGSEFFSSTKIAQPQARLPLPRLLLELEPRYRVFFGNLLDTLLFRPAPRVEVSSKPATFWPDVFVHFEMPWWGFLESMLWHMLFVAVLWSISQGVALRSQALPRNSARRSYISYYRPSPTFPVAGARAPRERRPATNGSAASSPLRVAREGKPGLVTPPDLKLGSQGQPDLAGSGSTLPSMPFSATKRSRISVPAGPNSAIGPPPEVAAASGRRGGLPQVSVVAPPPDVAAISSRRGLGAPGTAVVEPPPSVKGALRKFGDVNIGHSEVVAPAPRLPMHEQRAGVGVEQSGFGASSAVVPPPPSVERSGTLRGGRAGSMAASGTQVVPPPPSLQEAASSGKGRVGTLSAGGVQVVPPPPSAEGVGNAAGRGRGSALTGNNFGVVPPSPSGRDIGQSTGSGRGSSLYGNGDQVVPPPPSMEGIGSSAGGGRGTGLTSGGLGVVPPAPSGRGLGSTGNGRGRSLGGTGLQASGAVAAGGDGKGSGGGSGPGGSPNGKGRGDGGGGSEIASASGKGSGGTGGIGGGLGNSTGTSASAGAGGTGTAGNGVGGAAGAGGGGNGGANGGGSASGTASVAGTGSGAGTGGSGSTAGSPAGSPNGSNPDGANLGGGGRHIAADIPRARPPILDNPPGPQDLPVRVIGLAMALPTSSYFSNYEVFIAERRISKDETQLIKLVYVSLPYQRRLSEYGLNNRVFKLRVTRDPSCDESLMQMTWPDADQSKTGADRETDSPELSSGRNDKLPCYRTTAEDYRKAMSRAH